MNHPSLFFLFALLTMGVILVNGWTDAPNAIATCIATNSLSPRAAILLAAGFNFLGIVITTSINASVAMTIYHMVDFGGDSKTAFVALTAALFAIIVWAVAAWVFGIPTSESHALIAGLTGAAVAVCGNFSGVSAYEWSKVIFGLLFSLGAGFCFGFITVQAVEKIRQKIPAPKSDCFFGRAQIAGAAAMAFMHGAQDGQKFMGVFLLGLFLLEGQAKAAVFVIPFRLMVLCSVLMALGTSMGGMRIIKKVGMEMVQLEKHQGFAADLASALCLLMTLLTGIPVSTTHTKTAAIMGVGAAKSADALDRGIVKEMFSAWFLTFPGCGLMGFAITKLLLSLFHI